MQIHSLNINIHDSQLHSQGAAPRPQIKCYLLTICDDIMQTSYTRKLELCKRPNFFRSLRSRILLTTTSYYLSKPLLRIPDNWLLLGETFPNWSTLYCDVQRCTSMVRLCGVSEDCYKLRFVFLSWESHIQDEPLLTVHNDKKCFFLQNSN